MHKRNTVRTIIVTVLAIGAVFAAYPAAKAMWHETHQRAAQSATRHDGRATGVTVGTKQTRNVLVDGGRANKRPRLGFRNLVPGDSRSMPLRLRNRGTDVARAFIRIRSLRELPGALGGRLGPRLRLDILRAPRGWHGKRSRGGRRLWRGKVTRLREVRLGRIPAGGTAYYELRYKFLDGGMPSSDTTGDNRLQGSRVNVRYAVRASAPR